MKILTSIVFASALLLSIAGPVSAAYIENLEQQTQVSNAATRAQHVMGNHVMGRSTRAPAGADAMASEPADTSYRYFHDFGIGSQS